MDSGNRAGCPTLEGTPAPRRQGAASARLDGLPQTRQIPTRPRKASKHSQQPPKSKRPHPRLIGRAIQIPIRESSARSGSDQYLCMLDRHGGGFRPPRQNSGSTRPSQTQRVHCPCPHEHCDWIHCRDHRSHLDHCFSRSLPLQSRVVRLVSCRLRCLGTVGVPGRHCLRSLLPCLLSHEEAGVSQTCH